MYDIKWHSERYLGEGYKKIALQSARSPGASRKDNIYSDSLRKKPQQPEHHEVVWDNRNSQIS